MPRGLCRAKCAQYIGVSVSAFDDMVRLNMMPPPRVAIGDEVVWCRLEVDEAFFLLPTLQEDIDMQKEIYVECDDDPSLDK